MRRHSISIDYSLTQRRLSQIIADKDQLLSYCIQILKIKPEIRTDLENQMLEAMAENIKFFSHLQNQVEDKSLIKRCVNVLKYQQLKANSVLFNIGDTGTLFYIILAGTVGIFINIPTEQNKFELKQINVLNAGQSFGELALISENVQRTATVIAKTDCEFAIIEKENYQNIIGKIEAQKILKKITFISKFPFLEGWSFREIKTLSYHFEEIKVCFNDIIFKQNQESNFIYVVKEGYFEMTCSVDTEQVDEIRDIQENYLFGKLLKQKNVKICQLGEGDFFGEETFFIENVGFKFQLKKIEYKNSNINFEQKESDPDNNEEIQSRIKIQKQPEQWSKHYSRVTCHSESGLIYRISRQDIQTRFWDISTQKSFMRTMKMQFENRNKKMLDIKAEIQMKKKAQIDQIKLNLMLKKRESLSFGQSNKLRRAITPKISQNQTQLKNHISHNSQFNESEDLIKFKKKYFSKLSNGFSYRLQAKYEKEEDSQINQKIMNEYDKIQKLEQKGLKQFQILFGNQNFSFAQVKNYFQSRNLDEQDVMTKDAYHHQFVKFGKECRKKINMKKSIQVESEEIMLTQKEINQQSKYSSINRCTLILSLYIQSIVLQNSQFEYAKQELEKHPDVQSQVHSSNRELVNNQISTIYSTNKSLIKQNNQINQPGQQEFVYYNLNFKHSKVIKNDDEKIFSQGQSDEQQFSDLNSCFQHRGSIIHIQETG